MENQSTKPVISVIMSTYNESIDIVQQATESILNQSHQDWEFIIVVDKKANKPVVSYFAELGKLNTKIRVFINETPQGLSFCRNKGIKESQGRYVALMDADDISRIDRLQKQLAFIEGNNCDIVFSHVEYISETGHTIGYFEPHIQTKSVIRQLLAKHLFVHPSSFGKREVFLSESYDNKFLRSQDLDLWIRLLQGGSEFCILPEKLLQYRLTREGSTRSRIIKQRGYVFYSSKIFFKYFSKLWYLPEFWIFGIKRLVYMSMLYIIPASILSLIIKSRDTLLKR